VIDTLKSFAAVAAITVAFIAAAFFAAAARMIHSRNQKRSRGQ
jgi:hypothetical protein